MQLQRQVERLIREEALLDYGDSIVVAVSGGPDSAVLLDLLAELSEAWDWRLVVAHVNHAFRGEESDEEQQFVHRLGERYGLQVASVRIDVPAMIRRTRLGPQEAARRARYRFLAETAERYKAAKVALAHHADDQAETVLMRMLRGSGPAGLSGIPMLRKADGVVYVRPLLRSSKEEIVHYLTAKQLPHRIDSSNASLKYTRNRVRLETLPFLQQQFPEASKHLTVLSEIAGAENALLEEMTEQWANEIVERTRHACSFSRQYFLDGPLALQRRLIKLILEYLSHSLEIIDFHKLELLRGAIVQQAPPNLAMDAGAGVRLERNYDRIRFRAGAGPKGSGTADANDSGDYSLNMDPIGADSLEVPHNGGKLVYRVMPFDGKRTPPPAAGNHEAVFDLEQLQLPLSVRNRRPGDRMRIFGLNGSKKVKDIFIDAKISPAERERTPILTDGSGKLLWIAGLQRSGHAPVTDRTRSILEIRLIRNPGGAVP